jgi:hypothetical protein
MSKKALLDALPGERRMTIYHEEDGKTFIESRQDCEHIVKAAAMIAEEPPGKDFRHIGFIPETVMNQMLIDGSFHDPKAIRRFLIENPAFRTSRK